MRIFNSETNPVHEQNESNPNLLLFTKYCWRCYPDCCSLTFIEHQHLVSWLKMINYVLDVCIVFCLQCWMTNHSIVRSFHIPIFNILYWIVLIFSLENWGKGIFENMEKLNTLNRSSTKFWFSQQGDNLCLQLIKYNFLHHSPWPWIAKLS